MPVNIPNRSFTDITNDSIQYLRDNSQIRNLNKTSTAKLLLDAVAFESEGMYNFQKNGFLNAYLSTAQGGALDEFGFFCSCSRNTSQNAIDTSTNNFRFYIDPSYGKNVKQLLLDFYSTTEIQTLITNGYSTNGTNLIIPKNIQITNSNGNILYQTDSAVVINAQDTEGFSPVSALGNGESNNIPSNILTKHNISNIPELRKIANLILCENKFGIANGINYETDENYRWRLSNKIISNAGSNETAIRFAAFSVPGVRNVNIIPKAYGTGTFKVFVEGINPILTDGLLNAVKEAIQRVSSLGENVYIDHPSYLGVEMQMQIQFDYNANRDLIKEAARTTFIDYINNLEIGGEIVINEIIQRIMNTSNQIKDINIVLFGYGDYNKDTDVNENFIPLRLTNQQAAWFQKWYTNNKMCSICEFGSLQ